MSDIEKKGDGLEAFRKWLTPLLIVVTGWLVGQKMNDIDKKLDLVNTIQAAQAVLTNELNNNKDRIKRLEDRMEQTDRITNQPYYKDEGVQIQKRIR